MDIDTIYEIGDKVYIKRTFIAGGTHILEATIKSFKISVSELHGIIIRVIAAVADIEGVYIDSHGVEEIGIIVYPDLNNTFNFAIKGFRDSPEKFNV